MNIKKKKREDVKQFYVLVKHFVVRLFNNDILTYENERRERVIVVMVMLAAAGGLISKILLSPYLYPGFSGASAANIWIEKTAFLTMTMTMTGIFSVLNWENIFLDKKDYCNLLVLPIKRRDLFMAKFVSLFIFVGILSLAFNAVALLIFTFFLADLVAVNVFYFALTHFISNFLANLFVFLFVAAVQAVFTVLFKNKLFIKLANIIQVFLLMGFMSTFVWFPRVYDQLHAWKAGGSPLMYYFPPLWFTGLYEKMLGSRDVIFTRHLYIALLALILPTALYLLSSPLTFKRFLSFSQAGGNGSRVSRIAAYIKRGFNAVFLRNPIQRGLFYFILHTLRRSRFHKLQLAIYMALPFSYILTHVVFTYSGKGAVLLKGHSFFLASISLLLYLFLVVGIRMVVRHPILLEANWIFKVTEDSEKKHYVKGLKKAVIFFGGVPLFLLLLMFYAYCWGFQSAIFHSLYSAAVFLLLLEALFATYRKIPFAGAYDPDKPNLKVHWVLYLLGFIQYIVSFTSIGLMLLFKPKYYILFFVLAAGMVALLVFKRYEMYREEDFKFVYEEEGREPLMLTLDFNS